jgi:TIR domain
MFLSFALYEILDLNGNIDSYHIYPSDGGQMITDRIADVGYAVDESQVDLGPLRFYTEKEGLKITRTKSSLSQISFRSSESGAELHLKHSGLPIANETVGFYSLLLPKGLFGPVDSNVKLEQIWLTDEKRLLICAELTPWEDEWRRGLSINAKLVKCDPPQDGKIPQLCSNDVFRDGIDGLHHNSVRNFLRAVNRGLPIKAKSAFICHSSSDKEQARRISSGLSLRGIRVWLDEAEIRIGDSLIEKIEKGILNSNNLIAVLSPSSVESRWCQEELRMALSMQINGAPIRVLPAIVEDCDVPGFLKEKVYADFRDDWGFDTALEDICDAISSVHIDDTEQPDIKDENVVRGKKKSFFSRIFG